MQVEGEIAGQRRNAKILLQPWSLRQQPRWDFGIDPNLPEGKFSFAWRLATLMLSERGSRRARLVYQVRCKNSKYAAKLALDRKRYFLSCGYTLYAAKEEMYAAFSP